MKAQSCILFLSLWAGIVLGAEDVRAQVVPDTTLSTAVAGGPNYTITGGTSAGNNLYHSFSEFSVPVGGSAFFDNALTVENIFARVTGGTVSTIDGTLRTNGTANLFFLNPSGILLGPNASLNLGGSFIGATANSIRFADGIEFSAVSLSPSSLLTISTPVGLQMGQSPADITVQGTGHTLTSASSLSPFPLAASPSNLQVQPGQTLALVGGNLNLQGATLTALQGHIDLGSVSSSGLVGLTPTTQGYGLSYSAGQSFGDIQLTQRSFLNVEGINAGSAQLRGRQIQLADGSTLWSRNFGFLPGGEISLQASERIDLIGSVENATIDSGVQSLSFGPASGSNIRINTPQLSIQDGAALNTLTYGNADSGNIELTATNIELSGFSPLALTSGSATNISSTTFGAGNAGEIVINSQNLRLTDGSLLSSVTFGSGDSGEVKIKTTTTLVQGSNPIGLSSGIASTTLGTGSARSLILNTGSLQLLDGGTVAATALLIGAGGDVTVTATDAIEIRGSGADQRSSINSATLPPPLALKIAFGIPDILTANSGNVRIVTPRLVVTDGGTVSVTNQGSGNSGTVTITADTVYLDRQGSIQGQTASGSGGNLTLQLRDGLIMRNGSLINTTAGGIGNGGNITLNAPVIAGFENSDIIANAFQGNGGNINITTQGIFGLKFRPQLTPESDITASSQFGVNGTVTISDFSLDPDSGLVELPEGLADSSDQVAQGCSAGGGNSFIATGRGGVPASPNELMSRDRTWSDTRDLSEFVGQAQGDVEQAQGYEGQAQGHAPTEINTWRTNSNGQVELVAANIDQSVPQPYATCSVPIVVSRRLG